MLCSLASSCNYNSRLAFSRVHLGAHGCGSCKNSADTRRTAAWRCARTQRTGQQPQSLRQKKFPSPSPRTAARSIRSSYRFSPRLVQGFPLYHKSAPLSNTRWGDSLEARGAIRLATIWSRALAPCPAGAGRLLTFVPLAATFFMKDQRSERIGAFAPNNQQGSC